MMKALASGGGELGKHLQEVVSSDRTKWAYYFRVGDTPTVLYLIDPDNNPDDPSLGSWAGLFEQPFPETRPNYWTNVTGNSGYDHADPINTWRFADSTITASYQHLLNEREAMYHALLEKLDALYGK
jgi:hypothetical protein